MESTHSPVEFLIDLVVVPHQADREVGEAPKDCGQLDDALHAGRSVLGSS